MAWLVILALIVGAAIGWRIIVALAGAPPLQGNHDHQTSDFHGSNANFGNSLQGDNSNFGRVFYDE